MLFFCARSVSTGQLTSLTKVPDETQGLVRLLKFYRDGFIRRAEIRELVFSSTAGGDEGEDQSASAP